MFLDILFVSFLATVRANDWSTPCFNGTCQYTQTAVPGTLSSVLKIWGSPDAISDITQAAGYEIVDCSPDALKQDIRLVCTGNSSDCSHLLQGSGPEGKIVRLPESCGKSAFARVAKAWTPEDQSLPASIAKRLVHRDIQPEVKALTLDTDFEAINTARFGLVHFSIQGASLPDSTIVSPPVLVNRDIVLGRQLSNDFNITNTTTLQPIDADQPFQLFDQSIDCGPGQANVKVNVDAKAHAETNLGIVASGTIVPPNVDQFNMLVGLTADLSGTVNLIADVSGTLDSGKIPIFSVGVPGLSVPGVLEIGPSLEIDVQAKATLDLNLDVSVGLNYHVDNAQLNFPPSNGSVIQDDKFQITDTPLNLSASPAVASTGSVEVHVIPTLKFGITALKVVDTDVFLALDTSAALILTLEAQANAGQNIKRANRAQLLAARSKALPPAVPSPTFLVRKDYTATTSDSGAMPTSTRINPTCVCVLSPQSSVISAIESSETLTTTSSFATSASTTSSAAQSTSTGSNVDENFTGCFEVKAGFDVTAGAQGGFFNFFDQGTQVTLFSKSFELFKKCFGSQASRRSLRSSRSNPAARSLTNRQAGLVCPGANIGAPVPVTSQTVSAADIKPISA